MKKIIYIIKKILLWSAIFMMGCVALDSITKSFISFLSSSICAILLIPKVSDKLNEKLDNKFTTKVKIIFFIICFFITGTFLPSQENQNIESNNISETLSSNIVNEKSKIKDNYKKEEIETPSESDNPIENNNLETAENKEQIENTSTNNIIASSYTNTTSETPEKNNIPENDINLNTLETIEESQQDVESEENHEIENTPIFTSDSELEPISEPDPEPESNISYSSTYILNTNTKKFHYPSCSSVSQMKEHNKEEFNGSRDEIISKGYSPCKRCNP